MASTTDKPLLALALVFGCSRGAPPAPDPTPVQQPTDTGAATADTAPPGTSDTSPDTSDTGPAVDTSAPLDTAPPYPPCPQQAETNRVILYGDEDGDYAGRWVDVADIDDDGCAEVLVTEPWSEGIYGQLGVHSGAHLLQEPWETDDLADVAFATFEGSGANGGLDYWGEYPALLPTAGQVAMRGYEVDHPVHIYDLPSSAGVISPAAEAASIHAPAPYNELGVPSDLSPCTFANGGPALCVGTRHTNTDDNDWAGQILMYDAPMSGDVDVLSARVQLLGEPGDFAVFVDGRADLDGDGWEDLVVGAYDVGGTGKLAIVHAPPDGVHSLWDVADATLDGVDQDGHLGMHLSTADLDGDGHVDVMAGAPIATGVAYVAAGPFSGDTSLADATWTVTGAGMDEWVGYSGAITDLDGDGAADLAVGAPWSTYFGTDPGSVLVYHAPPPGTYDRADASLVLTSGLADPDAFGLAIGAGDIDGDGLGDLVVGAPRDPTAGVDGGSATIIFGASIP